MPLGNISEIQVGFQSREGIHSNPEGSHFLVQARDLNKYHQVQWSALTRFSPSGSTDKYELARDDILFLAKGQGNFSCLIDHEVKATLASNSFYILRASSENILPAYLAWWLNQSPAQEYIRLHRGGSSLPFITISLLTKLEITVPTFEIQKKVVELDKLQKREAKLTEVYLAKKSALIEALCLNAIII